MKSLLIGCGHSRTKQIITPIGKGWDELVTLDMTKDVNPTVVHNLEKLPYPFKNDEFDEIHAYEVMEHIGKQGDWKFFFNQFDEFARITKHYGFFAFTSPKLGSMWLWGDPGHTRYIGPEAMVFLNRDEYEKQAGKTAMTDYRAYFRSNWKMIFFKEAEHSNFIGLQNIKPKGSTDERPKTGLLDSIFKTDRHGG